MLLSRLPGSFPFGSIRARYAAAQRYRPGREGQSFAMGPLPGPPGGAGGMSGSGLFQFPSIGG